MMLSPLFLAVALIADTGATVPKITSGNLAAECLVRRVEGQTWIHAVARSSDGWHAVYRDGPCLRVSNLSGKDRLRIPVDSDSHVTQVAFAGTVHAVYVGDFEGNVFHFDLLTARKELLLRRKGVQVNLLAPSRDQRLLAFNGCDTKGNHHSFLWDCASKKEAFCFAHTVRDIAFSDDGNLLLVSSPSRLFALDSESFKERWSITSGEIGGSFGQVRVCPNARMLVATEHLWLGARMHVLDQDSGKPIRKAMAVSLQTPDLKKGGTFVSAMPALAEMSPSGTVLAWAFNHPWIKILEGTTMREALRIPCDLAYPLQVFFVSNTEFLSSRMMENGEICVWDLARSTAFKRFHENIAARKESPWDALKSLEPLYGVAATEHFRNHPKDLLTALRPGELLPARPTQQRFDALVRLLDDSAYRVREQATRELAAMGELVEDRLQAALEEKPSSETRNRIKEILSTLPKGDGMGPHAHRQLRVLYLLEQIGTAESKCIIERIERDALSSVVKSRAAETAIRLARTRTPATSR